VVVEVFDEDEGLGSGVLGSVEAGVVVVVFVSVWVAVEAGGGEITVTLGAGAGWSWTTVLVPGSVTTVGATGAQPMTSAPATIVKIAAFRPLYVFISFLSNPCVRPRNGLKSLTGSSSMVGLTRAPDHILVIPFASF
jgi:hypothetical protein